MKFVVDTNVLFSFFRKESETRRLISNFEFLQLFTASFCIDELQKYKGLICEKSNLSDKEFEEVLNDLLIFVKIFSIFEYKEFLSNAKQISPDPNDVDIFALALKLSCSIWSEEKLLKKQSKVRVFSTKELLELLKTSY